MRMLRVMACPRPDADDGRAAQIRMLIENRLALVGKQRFLAGLDAL